MWLGFTKANVLGKELVDDGDFLLTGTQAASTTGTYWKTAAGWTISGGVATYDAVAETYLDNLNSINIGIGDIIKVTFTLNSDAKLRFVNQLGSRFSGTWVVYQAGTYTEYLTSGITAISLGIQGDTNNGSFGVSNISVKEVAQFAPDKSLNTNEAKLFTGKALEFNGNDTVSLGSKGPTNTTVFSCVFWVKPTLASDSGDTNVLRYGRFNVWFSHNTQLHVYPNDQGDATVFTIPNATGKWQRFVLSISGLETSLYIDGILFETRSSIAISTTLRSSFIGSYNNDKYLIGLLSDLQIYDKNWTSDDAVYDYANPNNLVIDSTSTLITKSNLIGYWALSEGSGNIAFDSAGLGGELVTNGGFATDTDWIKGIGWTISGGLASCDGSQVDWSILQQNSILPSDGERVHIIITTTGYAAGLLYVKAGYSDSGYPISSNGTFTIIRTVSGASQFRLQADLDFIGSISNISVREVTDNDGTGAFLNTTPAVIGATWVNKQPTIPQLGMMDWSKSSNLLAYSEDFDNANWTKTGTTVQLNSITSPDGYNNGTKLKASADGSASRRIRSTMSPIKDNQTYTYSIYVKKADVNFFNISIATTSFPSSSGAWFNVESGTVTRTYSGLVSSSITNVGDGWFRCTVTATSDSTSGNNVDLYMSSVDQTLTYTGVTGEGLYIFGAQFEESTTAGSYIRTGFSTAIDATLIQNPNDLGKDVLGNSLRLRDGGFNLDGIGYAEVADDASLDVTSAVTLECWVKWNTEHEKGLIAKHGGGDNVRSFLMQKVTNGVDFYLRLGSLVAASSASVTGTGDWKHIACTYNGSTQTIYIDGSVSGTPVSRSGNIQATTRDVEIGRYNGGSYYSDIIDEARIYDRALSATEVLNNYKVGLSKHS